MLRYTFILLVLASTTFADETPQKYELRYRFQKGETLSWDVKHLLKVRTAMQKTEETVETFCRSTKKWTVVDVDEKGIAVIEHLVEKAEMKRKQTGREDSAYNSEKDDVVPHGFDEAASNIGVPLARISLDSLGNVTKKLQLVPYIDGTFENKVLMTLPQDPVAIGESWRNNYDIPLPQPNGTVRKIKARQVFTLQDVKTGIATIGFLTEILSPIADEPKIEVQLLDKNVSGTIKLDLDNGRLLFQQSDVNQRVIGFQGPSSNVHHQLRFSEDIVP